MDHGIPPEGQAGLRLFGVSVRAYPKTVGDWLILRSPRSKMCLSPSLSEVLG